ncbi:MAG: hypothetical protein IPJ28_11585 [Betaproteobacteria bacterium]|nr:hypothetical protein [Betaproteobacteria bacterium]
MASAVDSIAERNRKTPGARLFSKKRFCSSIGAGSRTGVPPVRTRIASKRSAK